MQAATPLVKKKNPSREEIVKAIQLAAKEALAMTASIQTQACKTTATILTGKLSLRSFLSATGGLTFSLALGGGLAAAAKDAQAAEGPQFAVLAPIVAPTWMRLAG